MRQAPRRTLWLFLLAIVISLLPLVPLRPGLEARQTGSITGTVTHESSGALLQNVDIYVYEEDGNYVDSVTTNASGQYMVTGLADGSYFLSTGRPGSLNVVDEVHPNITCVISCPDPEEAGAPIAVAGGTPAVVNFALAPGATVTGVVTSETTGLPIANAQVALRFQVPNGSRGAGAQANASGVYSFTGLAGAFYALEVHASGWIGEALDNGTPFPVAAGATVTKNLALRPSGQVTGTVTAAGTGLPIANVSIAIYGGTPLRVVDFESSNGSGVYQFDSNLSTGDYVLVAEGGSGFLPEIYDNVPCPGPCNLSVYSGARIAVTEGMVTSGKDFVLAPGGQITGTVRDQGTLAPIPFAGIAAIGPGAPSGRFVQSDENGVYSVQALASGSYALYTYDAPGGRVREVFADLPCTDFSHCEALARESGTPVAVTAGATTSGRDFTLAAGGRFSGTLRTGAGAGLAGTVFVVSSDGRSVTTISVNASGSYVSAGDLPGGPYFAHARAFDGLASQIYSGKSCSNCANHDVVAEGTPFTVTAGNTTSGIDFTFQRGGRLRGRVTDAVTGNPLEDVTIVLMDAFSGQNSDSTGEDGVYEFRGLRGGTYRVFTSHEEGYRNEVFPDRPCDLFCTAAQVAAGQAMVVTAGAETTGIDFALARGGSISGRVTAAATGQPLLGADVSLVAHGATEDEILRVGMNEFGVYTFQGLPDGTYHAFAAFGEYVSELNGNIPCPGRCTTNLAALSPGITVTGGSATTGVDFALDAGGRITGLVSNAATGVPADNMTVVAVDAAGREVRAASYSGGFLKYGIGPVPPGTYYLYTASDGRYVDEIWNDVPCQGACTGQAAAALGTPVSVPAGATVERDFSLTPGTGGRITGAVTRAPGGIPLRFAGVRAFDSAGRNVGDASTDGVFGRFDISVPPGTYYLMTDTQGGSLADEAYDNIPCVAPPCSPAKGGGGTPVVVTQGVTTAGKDFALSPRSGVPGPPGRPDVSNGIGGVLIEWNSPRGGGIAQSYLLEAGLSPGTTIVSIPVTGFGHVAAGVPPGRYFLRIRGINAAGTGPASTERELVVGAGGSVRPAAPEDLAVSLAGRRLTLSWDAPDSDEGGLAASYMVEAGSAPGLANIGILPAVAGGRVFTYEPVPDGFYFLRVRAQNAAGLSEPSNEVMIVVGAVPAPPLPPLDLAGVVSGTTVTLNWFAPPGTVTGYVVEAGSAPGLADLAVASVAAGSSASFTGVPPGTYYVRVRARNAAGLSIVSNQITIVVN